MGEGKEVSSARNGKDSSLDGGITDSSRGDNGENDKESRFNVRNKTMSSSSHVDQEDDHNGGDQELGFPTSNTNSNNGVGVTAEIGSGSKYQEKAKDGDNSGKQQLSFAVIGSSFCQYYDTSNQEKYQRDSVIINIEEITEAGGGKEGERHHYYASEDDELSNNGGTTSTRYSYPSGESLQLEPDRFSSAIGYLKDMVAAMKGISENLGTNRSLEETVKSQHATIHQMNIDLEARNSLEETIKSQNVRDLEARNALEETNQVSASHNSATEHRLGGRKSDC
ncbi:hypothetical protein MKW98_015907 [Papaver atlanticum]|uniref:Uncharacterized protein n=1 Tax=Papaver atlanticum TaxID=357466 RepID=A0AAD4SUQ3_9MAGN|nr:hypothetical protein MKW98_015907 [Papaver atlanticum]